MGYIFGRAGKQIYSDSPTVPDKEKHRPLNEWFLMAGPKPQDGQEYEAQADGTWMLVAPSEDKVAENNLTTSFREFMALFDGLPINPGIAVLFAYVESVRVKSGATSAFISQLSESSGYTEAQVTNKIFNEVQKMSISLGKLVAKNVN